MEEEIMTAEKLRMELELNKEECKKLHSKKLKVKQNTCTSNDDQELFIPSLPNDLVFNILVRLPADIIYMVMRLVCQEWRKIIEDHGFIDAHLHRSSYTGLLASGLKVFDEKIYVDFLDIDYRSHNCKGSKEIGWKKIFAMEKLRLEHDSCDGLVLVSLWSTGLERSVVRVVNPVRKEHVSFTVPEYRNCNPSGFTISIARAKSSRKYKVVYAYVQTQSQYVISLYTLGCENYWRTIKMGKVNYCPLPPLLSRLSVNGFVYFHADKDPDVLLALDVENEMVHQVRPPNQYKTSGSRYDSDYRIKYIKSENFLVFVFYDNNVYDFWGLDEPICGDWKKLYRIDLSKNKSIFYRPFVLLEEDSVLFRDYSSDYCMVYKVKTGAMFYFKAFGDHHYCWVAHKKSLVSLG